ncbi:MAG: ATP-binding protein [Candidatus Sedimenticola sp. (ex Thyasira tokunagai)]
MRLLPRSLFGRLVLILTLGLILTQVLGTALTFRDRHRILRDNIGLQLIQRIASVVNLVEGMPPQQHHKIITALDSRSLRITLTQEPLPAEEGAESARPLKMMLGRELERSTTLDVTTIPLSEYPNHQPPPWMKHSPAQGRMMQRWMPRRMLGFQAQVQLSTGEWLTFRRPLPEESLIWPVKLLGYLLILLISVAALSLLAVRLATRPLNTLAEAADHLGKDIQHPPLDESGPLEVRKAAQAFNTMQGRLQRYIEDKSQILAAISHDLKTPITRLRLRTEMLNDEALKKKFSGDLDAMEEMVIATLDFMRGTENSEKVVLVDITALLESMKSDMEEMGWQVTLKNPTAAPYNARPLALKRCLGNLIENAARYGEEAIIHVEDRDDQLTITITDQGSDISEEELDTLFKPFYRGENSRSRESGGTGLGLGIARNIARAHGGEMILQRGDSGGLKAIITLPR